MYVFNLIFFSSLLFVSFTVNVLYFSEKNRINLDKLKSYSTLLHKLISDEACGQKLSKL